MSDVEDDEELEEDDDPSLKVQPAPASKKSSKKPASKAKPKPASRAASKSKSRTNARPEEVEHEDVEVDTNSTRSRTKSGKKADRDEEREKSREVDPDKPPSNVDGKVSKPYIDFEIAIDAPKPDKSRKATSRGRSKSKSRSTSVASVDPHSKPLLRAASRSRASGYTEIEDERETERMLAMAPSDTEGADDTRNLEPSFPAPTSPSDFKAIPEKRNKALPASRTDMSSRPRSPSPQPRAPPSAPALPKKKEKSKSFHRKTKADAKIDSGQTQAALIAMEVDNEGDVNERTEHSVIPNPEPNSRAAIDGKGENSSSRPSEEPEPRTQRPITPEDQIMVSEPSKPSACDVDFQKALRMPPSPAGVFLPPLANQPVRIIAELSEEERSMTVEQWIRYEMTTQYEKLKEDGERRIDEFLERAAETRRQIEAL